MHGRALAAGLCDLARIEGLWYIPEPEWGQCRWTGSRPVIQYFLAIHALDSRRDCTNAFDIP